MAIQAVLFDVGEQQSAAQNTVSDGVSGQKSKNRPKWRVAGCTKLCVHPPLTERWLRLLVLPSARASPRGGRRRNAGAGEARN
jgi:hypothetical protein